ncbi:MAG TPA: MCT family MFS transporter [Candidatus Binataceae bacterium]|nr:MCT family MFS transporter [Candidatus Binataceae bacterium]
MPDSGLDSAQAWLMAALAFVTCLVVFGVVYSFGAFFKPMASEFGASEATTSAVFAITAAIYNLLGVVGGHLSDRFGPRPVVIAGALTMGIGLLSTSYIDRLWLIYLTYGLGVGVAVALTYVPMLAVVGGWFLQRRNTAMGVAVSGIGCGTLLFAPMAAWLIERYGWREAYALMAICSAVALGICGIMAKAPPEPITTGQLYLWRAARTPNFTRLYLSSVLVSISIYTPFVYLPDFAESLGIPDIRAASLVGFIGAASIGGRLALGTVADRTGIIPLYKLTTIILGLSYVVWVVSHGYGVLIIFAITMGVAYGGLVALSPAVVAELFGVAGLGAMLGALYTSSAISSLAGPPLVGLLMDYTGSNIWAPLLAGISGVLTFVILIPLRHSEGVQPGISASELHPDSRQRRSASRSG